MTYWQGYLIIFDVLKQYYFETDRDDGLRPLLSDMSPYTFKEGYSADPAVWEDWKKCVQEICGAEDNIEPSQLKTLLFVFLQLYRDEWSFELDNVISALRNDPTLDETLQRYAAEQ